MLRITRKKNENESRIEESVVEKQETTVPEMQNVASEDLKPANGNSDISTYKARDKGILVTQVHCANNSQSSQRPINSQVNDENCFKEEIISEPTGKMFEELVVDTCCTKLFPTHKAIPMFGGPSRWQRATNVIISMIAKLGLQQPPSFHFLRICADFANIVSFHKTSAPYALYVLGALAPSASCDFWDSEETFDNICQLVEGQQDKGAENVRRLQEFLIHFFLRCISANPDTPLLERMMSKLCSVTEKDLLRYASPLVQRILMAEETEVFEAILEDAQVLQEIPSLQSIDNTLGVMCLRNQSLPFDCHFAVMCCDIIGQVAFHDLHLAALTKSDDLVLSRMHTAISIVSDTYRNESMFRFLVSVAYLRAFLTSVASAIVKDISCLQREGNLSVLLKNVSTLLEAPTVKKCKNPRKSACTYFLLRELRKSVSMFDLRKLCENASKMTILSSIPWTGKGTPRKVVSFSLSENADNKKVETAFLKLLNNNDKEHMKKVCSSLNSSCSLRKAFALLLTDHFFLLRSIRNLGDSEDKAAEFIMKVLPKVEMPFRRLLGCISGKEDFHAPEMKISPESSACSVKKAALILHLAVSLIAKCTCSTTSVYPFLSLILQPTNCADSFVPGIPDSPKNDGRHRFELCSKEILQDVSLYNCTCSTLFASRNSEFFCPWCHFKCVPLHQMREEEVEAANKGYVAIHINQIDDEAFRVRNMTPVSFRVLHLFVHAALYSGTALRMFSVSELSHFLLMGNSNQDPAQECFIRIENNLEVLCRLLAWSEERVIDWLHQVLEETSDHLAQRSRTVAFQTEQSRDQWEIAFSRKVETSLRDSLRNGRACKEEGISTIEERIEEKDPLEHMPDISERNLHIPRLFRATKPKSHEDFKAQYYLASEEEKKQHPLLGLFLDYHTTLPYVNELFPLIAWSRMLDTCLSHRLSCKGAEKSTIDDIIRGENLPDDLAKFGHHRRRNTFLKFKASWEKVKYLVDQYLGPNERVPYVNELSPVGFCLVNSKGNGRYLYTALQILQRIQNEFQRKVLRLAANSDCAALDFLRRSDEVSSLAIVRLQDIKEKEVISYQWTDDIMCHSYHNTDYGHGKEVIYDFGKIEKELAGRFLIGRVYFSDTEPLREFSFSGELFHTCANVLNELGATVRQEPLTENLKSALDRLKSESLKTAQDLLEHMEVVICLLKATGAPDDTLPLEDYTDRWLSSSRPFPKALLPEPSKEFQLRHVVALYEGLEDLLAESAADTIHDDYRCSLPDELKMIAECKNAIEESAVRAVVTAIRRFIFRYLLCDKFHLDPVQNASRYFEDSSLWPMESGGKERSGVKCDEPQDNSLLQRAVKFLPDELTVGHVFGLMNYYQGILKAQDLKRPGSLGRTSVGRNTGFKAQRKRKLAITFG